MRRVLILITTAYIPTGGLASVMMNYYRNIDKSGLLIDFASTNEVPEVLVNELSQNGSQYYCLGARKNVLTYFRRLYKVCIGYDVIHVNGNSATTVIELLAAKMAGIRKRIHHNHTAKTEHRVLHNLMLPFFRHLYTVGLACSENAGNWLFGEGKFSVLRNAIETEKYRFSSSLREKYRGEYDIPSNAFVIGHVGKYNPIKNHFKLIEIFKEYYKIHKDAMLLCVGYGPLQKDLEEYIDELGLVGKVILTGERTDTPGFLSAMDVFVFPSKYEGLGMAVIEAQASGLPCLVSDRVPKDVFMSDHIYSAALEETSNKWVVMIDNMKVEDRNTQSHKNIVSITEAGYNIKTEAGRLRELYLK